MVDQQFIMRDAEHIGPASERAIEFLPEDVRPLASMRALAPTVTKLLGADAPAHADAPAIAAVLEVLQGTERLAHIVIDAFGVATWQCHKNVSGTFNRIAAIRQTELQSVLPAITPVNFATIGTGASPETHGISQREQPLEVDTTFARLTTAGKTSAVCGRALSTAGLLLSQFSSTPSVAESNIDKEVLDLFVERMNERIDYVLAQLLDIDEAGHQDGPWGLKTHQAVGRTNQRLLAMLTAAAENGYSIFVHADHGQHDVEPEDEHPKPEEKGTHSGRCQEDVRVPFVFLTNAELNQALEA